MHSKEEIATFAQQNPFLYSYELGDLDDFFWQHTIWFALKEGHAVQQLALLYTELNLPVLLAHSNPPAESMRLLLRSITPCLPKRLYAHLGILEVEALAEAYQVRAHGLYYKMGLRHPDRVMAFARSGAVKLSGPDLGDLETLYRTSYPGNWFVPSMLQTGFYYGIREGTELVSVAGVHICAPSYRVAALGNVTTHPRARGRGLATAACAKLCQELIAGGMDTIGLNVKADNLAAIRSYEKLGFQRVAEYGEYTLESK